MRLRQARAASSQAALTPQSPNPLHTGLLHAHPRHPGVRRAPRKALSSTAGPLLGAGCCPPPTTHRAPHLCAQWAVAFEKVRADLCLPGHVDMAVGTVAVAANPLQEVGAHGHLRRRGDRGEGQQTPPAPFGAWAQSARCYYGPASSSPPSGACTPLYRQNTWT